MSKPDWVSNTLEPFGDGSVQITISEDGFSEDGSRTGLFTWRGGKDRDLTAEQFEALEFACSKAAARLRAKVAGREE